MVMRNSDVGRTSDGARTGAGGARGAALSSVILRYPPLSTVIQRYPLWAAWRPLSRGVRYAYGRSECAGDVGERLGTSRAAVIRRYPPFPFVIQDNGERQVLFGVRYS